MRNTQVQLEGYEVDTAYSAEEALKLNLSAYHLFLLDVMMGEISGFHLARMIKLDAKTAHIPIIFITAKDTENDTIHGFNIGADDYISKPFSIREVLASPIPNPHSGHFNLMIGPQFQNSTFSGAP